MKMSPSILAAAVTVVMVLCLSESTSAAVLQRVKWKVRTFTSDIRHAGTDDTVAIRLVGSKGSTQSQVLDTSRNDFQRGADDRFFITVGVDIGTPRSISMIGGGGGDGWHLDRVELTLVDEMTTGHWRVWTFNCDCWFDADELDNIYEGFHHMSLAMTTGRHRWLVSVLTSDISDAGTDDDVKIIIHEFHGETRLIKLDEPGRDNFRRGSNDTFTIATVDFGDPRRLTVEAGSGGDGWHLDEIILRLDDRRFTPMRTHQYHFVCNDCWFDGDHPATTPIRRIINATHQDYLEPENYSWINPDATTVNDGTGQDSTGQDNDC